MNMISFVFGDELPKTPYRRTPMFYSLFCALFDCKYGLPKMNLGRIPINKDNKGAVRQALIELGNEITAEEPKAEYVELVSAYLRSTDKLKERQIRHRYLWNAIKSAVNS
jgi:hypothetical protein